MSFFGVGIGDWAQVLTAASAIIALFFGAVQVLHVRKSQKEATAMQIWSSVQKLAIEHPRFASPHLAEIDFAAKTFDGCREKYQKYTWFVSYALLACEEVLRLDVGVDEWSATVDDMINIHRAYLASDNFRPYLNQLAPAIRKRI